MKPNGLIMFVAGVVMGTGLVMAMTTPTLKEQHSAILSLENSLDEWNKQGVQTTAALLQCKDDRSAITVLLDPPAPAAPAMPLPFQIGPLHLAVTGDVASKTGVWVIPMKVVPQTAQAGARYRWIDSKTGAQLGEFPAGVAVVDQAAQ